MNLARPARFALISLVFCLSACGDRLLVEDNSPFSEGVVRMGDTEVAEIDGTKIYLSDVERTAAAQGLIDLGSPLTPGQPVFQRVLDELIDQRLLALDALRQSLDQQDETRRRLAMARERILGNVLVEQHLQETVNATTIRRMYEEQAVLRNRGDQVRLRHILVKDEKTAIEVEQKLIDGVDFAVLAGELSEDAGSRERGGEIDWSTKDMFDFDPAFAEMSFSTPEGERSVPFRSGSGWHIVEILDRRKAPQPSFEEMRSEIKNFMTYDEIQNLLKSLRATGDVNLLYTKAQFAPGDDAAIQDPAPDPDTP